MGEAMIRYFVEVRKVFIHEVIAAATLCGLADKLTTRTSIIVDRQKIAYLAPPGSVILMPEKLEEWTLDDHESLVTALLGANIQFRLVRPVCRKPMDCGWGHKCELLMWHEGECMNKSYGCKHPGGVGQG